MVRTKFTPLRPNLQQYKPESVRKRGRPTKEEAARQKFLAEYMQDVARKTRELRKRRRELAERSRLERMERDRSRVAAQFEAAGLQQRNSRIAYRRHHNYCLPDTRYNAPTYSGESSEEDVANAFGYYHDHAYDLPCRVENPRHLEEDVGNDYEEEDSFMFENEKEEEGREAMADVESSQMVKEERMDVLESPPHVCERNDDDADDEHSDYEVTSTTTKTPTCANHPANTRSKPKPTPAPPVRAMVEEPGDPLAERFGSARHYDHVFRNNLSNSHITEIFRVLEHYKGPRSCESRYEAARQEFIKYYGQFKGKWHSTPSDTDRRTDAVKLHRKSGGTEYIGFLRIHPGGYRGERSLPSYMQLKIHLLIGKVLLTYKKKPRTMLRGSHVHLMPGNSMAMKCISHDQEALFVMKVIIDKEVRNQ